MIPFFNIPIPPIPNIFHFPVDIRQGYEIRREHAFGNRDFRNLVLIMPLEQSLTNLKQIESRIDSRILKEEDAGRDMSDEVNLFNTAHETLSLAEIAVAEATSTASTNALHPSYINAHLLLNDARKSFGRVLDSIGTSTDDRSSTINE